MKVYPGFKVSDAGLPGHVPVLTLRGGLKIPQLGLGVYELDGAETYACVKEALRLGYRLIDTAEYYHNEAETYNAVVGSGIPRDEIFIISKLEPCRGSEREIRAKLEDSLYDMGGYIDLMLIHWPFAADRLAWSVMEEYVKAGSFGAIGLSNYHPDGVKRIMDGAEVLPVLNQIELHPYYQRLDEIKANEALGLKVQAWSPLGGGMLKVTADPVIRELAQKYGRTPAQMVLRYEIECGVITIPRSKNFAHLRENFRVFDFELAPEDALVLAALDRSEMIWDI